MIIAARRRERILGAEPTAGEQRPFTEIAQGVVHRVLRAVVIPRPAPPVVRLAQSVP